jgi:uncharacterized protein DUF551
MNGKHVGAGEAPSEKGMSGWIEAKRRKPRLTKEQRRPNAFGVQVLIWPPYKSDGANDAHVAFFGCRYSDKPDFYLYGRGINVTHWQPLPKGPTT